MSHTLTKNCSEQIVNQRVQKDHPQHVPSSALQKKTHTKMCSCPQCGMKIKHQKGIPCVDTHCPFCGTPMTGK
jgi:hypothetical protein